MTQGHICIYSHFASSRAVQGPPPALLIAMATAGLSLKLVVEASRGAVIAVHAAGGLARGHVQAQRLLRAAEGLCRSAVAVLQTDVSMCKKNKGVSQDKPSNGPPASHTGRGDKPSNGPPASNRGRGGKGGSKTSDGPPASGRGRGGKGTGKDSDEGMGVTPTGPRAQPRRRRRGRAPVAAAAPVVPEFDDSWADGVHVAPPAQALALPLDDAAVRGRRPLVARHSSSRSPRRLSPVGPAPAVADAAEPLPLEDAEPLSPALLAGQVATIKGLLSRPDLEDVLVVLDEQDVLSGRWICHVKGGEKVRILPDKLAPIPESGQKFSRLRYDTS